MSEFGRLKAVEQVKAVRRSKLRNDDLSKTSKTEILPNVIIGKIAKSCHPNICSNKYTDRVVNFCCCKVVVHQKENLQNTKKTGMQH